MKDGLDPLIDIDIDLNRIELKGVGFVDTVIPIGL